MAGSLLEARTYMDKVNTLRSKIRLTPKQVLGGSILLLFVLIAIFAPILIKYDPWQVGQTEEGTIPILEPPSSLHYLGTTNLGRDIYSQLIIGTRASLLVGFVAAICVTLIGTNMGLLSGYFGGWVDDIIMRLVDTAYVIPFVPFVIILVSLLEPSTWNTILGIVLAVSAALAYACSEIVKKKTRKRSNGLF